MLRFSHTAVGVQQGDEVLFSAFEDGGPMWTDNGPRVERLRVTFADPFLGPPVIHVSLSMWDIAVNTTQRADVTAEELRARSWWSGPRIYLLVDDLDLVITGGGNPLQPLARFLPHARDIGLSVVLARRSAGASRALFDPFVARIRDLGGAGLVMSGSREEGPLLGGVRPGPLPAGRGRLVTRDGGVRLVQTALSEP